MKQKQLSYRMGQVVVLCYLVFASIGFCYTPFDPQAMDATRKFAEVSMTHPLGCDQFGRDILSRAMVGSGTTLLIAIGTIVIGGGIGILVGGFSGYYGGRFDTVVMRLNDTLFSFPSILLALLFVGVMGPGTKQVVIALGISFIPSFLRMARAEIMTQKNMDYVHNAKLLGASSARIVLLHILPNSKNLLLSSLMIGFNNAVLAEAGLSYLGLGVAPPNPSIGGMLSEAQSYLFTAPSYTWFVGGGLILFLIGTSFVANGLGRKQYVGY